MEYGTNFSLHRSYQSIRNALIGSQLGAHALYALLLIAVICCCLP